jgi:tetratricopeptide (TPR) repeat protein
MEIRNKKLWQRGVTHFRQGNMPAARASFEAFLALDPESSAARFQLSVIHARNGRLLVAIALAEEVLAAQGDGIEILTHLARCHLISAHLEISRALATRALAMPRENPVALDSLGVVMTMLDEQSMALELFDQAIELESRQGSMYFNRGIAQRQFGLLEGAERDFESCLAINPAHGKAHWGLATLSKQDAAHNHLPRLRDQLSRTPRAAPQDEHLSLALFKELDDLSESKEAWPPLERAIIGRRERWQSAQYEPLGSLDTLLQVCDEPFLRQYQLAKSSVSPVFIFGMPRAGSALLGKVLSRHSKIQHLGYQQVFARLLSEQLGRDSLRPLDSAAFEQCRTLDFSELGRRFLDAAAPSAGKELVICESQPMNFRLAGFIARALPGARMLHLVRDPMDTCVSILAHPGGEPSLPTHDPAGLAAYFLAYQRLMQHWHELMPGRIMDVSYESLVEKPEMILRVVCSFIGIRYGSALRTGLQLQQQTIGRGQRYAAHLPRLSAALAPPPG